MVGTGFEITLQDILPWTLSNIPKQNIIFFDTREASIGAK
jgi:hypothetical protein